MKILYHVSQERKAIIPHSRLFYSENSFLSRADDVRSEQTDPGAIEPENESFTAVFQYFFKSECELLHFHHRSHCYPDILILDFS